MKDKDVQMHCKRICKICHRAFGENFPISQARFYAKDNICFTCIEQMKDLSELKSKLKAAEQRERELRGLCSEAANSFSMLRCDRKSDFCSNWCELEGCEEKTVILMLKAAGESK